MVVGGRDYEYQDEGAFARPLSPVILPSAPIRSALKKPGQTRRYKKQVSVGELESWYCFAFVFTALLPLVQGC